MNKSLIIIGIVLLVIGIVAGAFITTQSHLFGLYTTTSTPYAAYMIPLLVGGIILIIVGALTGKKE
ncbi:hypothetical protein COT07_04105 [Candidatus Woesearchaeota archaeon CG07_land_8_20_14_0_80_44_23]|nr:MAG: hypothetical protein COT07_04105 [Candidatus Woesearchaeota archaeon CG07_land_8_20_14_0_80_44_23]